MANKIQLKRSSVSGKVPTTTDVDLGELALNTYDGKLYTKKSDGTTETVVQLSVDSTVVKTTDTGSVTSAIIADGTIVNGDINASAAIAHSKLASIAAGSVLLGNATNVPTATALSGDVTVNSSGMTAIASGAVVNADVSASAAIAGTKISPDFGSQTVTTTGVISAAAGAAATPSIAFTGDLNTGIYSPGADQVAISTNGTGRLFVDASGKVGIGGTASPDAKLTIVSTRAADVLSFASYFDVNGSAGDKNRFVLGCSSGSVRGIEIIAERPGSNNAHSIIFSNSRGDSVPQEAARIDSSGRLLVGTSSSSVATSAVFQGHSSSSIQDGRLFIQRGATSLGANTRIGQINFADSAGNVGVSIESWSDGTWAASSYPGRIVLSTTLDGASSPTERFRITNDGVQCYNQPAPTSKSAAATLTVAELKTGIIQYTGAADTLTLPTGTLTEGGFAGIYTNMTFEWSVINTGTGTCTIGAGTNHTIVGDSKVDAAKSGRFASRRTAANTFVSYRLS